MAIPPTLALYLDDDHCFDADAVILVAGDDGLAFDRTCFYPGGGGQPPDTGVATLADGSVLEIAAARADADAVIWHLTRLPARSDLAGQSARLSLDRVRRLALMRHHTALHVLNTLALREHGGWITGAQIGVEHSRIDFNLAALSAALCDALQARANEILGGNRPLRAYEITEAEFHARPELLRTLEAAPPVRDGRVRVVEIDGFDAQACGGTHVRSTAEVGRLTIVRTENKGRNNKRLYVRLDAP